jgi:hypothetical protein
MGHPDGALRQEYINAVLKPYNGNVAAAGTPETIEAYVDLSRNAKAGWVSNRDATGTLYVYLSTDGTKYNGYDTLTLAVAAGAAGRHELPAGYDLPLDPGTTHTIKIDADANGTKYAAAII